MDRLRAFWNRGWFAKAIVSIVGLLIVCCVIGIFAPRRPSATAGQPTAAAADVATAGPQVTTAPEPTSAPEPTALPATAVPTVAYVSPTPKPTFSPPPTPTESNALTAEERQAVVEMGTHLSNIGQGLSKIGELSRNADLSDAWKLQMAAAITLVRTGHAALVEMKVPPKIEHLQSSIVDATTDCNAAMDKLVSGLDNSSAKDLQAGGALMRSCGSKIQEARPELNTLLSQT